MGCIAFVVQTCSEKPIDLIPNYPVATTGTFAMTEIGSWDCVQSGSGLGGAVVDPAQLANHETVCTLTCDPGYAYKDAAETEITCHAEAGAAGAAGPNEWRVNGVALAAGNTPSCEPGEFNAFVLL